jgi:hypothetical protein
MGVDSFSAPAGGRRAALALVLGLAVAGAAVGGSAAQQSGSLRIELNRLEPVQLQGNGSCRIYLLTENPGNEVYRTLRLDLVAIDTDGVIAKRLSVDVGPLSAKKTSVKLFDFAGLPCDRFSRVLLNEALACETGAGPKADCLDNVEVRSRVGKVSFDK